MRTILRKIGAAALFVAATAVLSRAADPKTNWLRVQAGDVTVLSDASQKDAVEYAVKYSAFRRAVSEMLAPPGRKIPPSTVLLFRSGREFERRFAPANSSKFDQVSLSTEVDGSVLIGQVLTGGDRDEALRMAFEFDTISMFRQLGYYVPLWMSQGTGKVFSTLTIRKGVVKIGDTPSGMADGWIGSAVKWPRFFEVHSTSPEYLSPERASIYHSQAWALMHRVWLGAGDGRERFRELVAKVRTGPDLAAVEAVLGVDASKLSAEIVNHLGAKRRTIEIPFDEMALRSRLEITPAAAAEIAVHFSNLLYAARKPFEAEQELKDAEMRSPESPWVKEALARQAFFQRDSDRGVELYREAIAHGSTSPRAYLISANHWLDQASVGRQDEAGGGSTVADKAIVEIRRALELRPADPEAYRLLGRAFFLRPEITEEHLHELEAGVGSADVGGQIRFYRALLLNRLKRTADFEAALLSLCGDTHADVEVRGQAGEFLHNLAFDRTRIQVESLVNEKRFGEARQLIADQKATDAGRPRADLYDRLLRWVIRAER